MFRHRRTDLEWHVEDTAGRLGRALAQTGPHDHRIGHHRTHEGNTDPTRTGLALVVARPPARVLRLTVGSVAAGAKRRADRADAQAEVDAYRRSGGRGR